MSDRTSSCATASLLAVLFAAPAAALVPPAVELVRPRAGETLTGGAEAVVEWRLLEATLDPTIVEWEAFLSFDGGGYYAVRVTPHLDASRRRFQFRVPNVATENARIMLRFGDEVIEVGVEIPHRFVIRSPAFVVPQRGRRSPARGESARPGEPGVVAWVEGTRAGEGLEVYESYPVSSTGAAMLAGPVESVPALVPATSKLLLQAAGVRAPRPRPPSPGDEITAAIASTSILLLSCRRNE